MMVLDSISAEHELLLLLARRALTPDLQARARLLACGPISWPVFIRQAVEHGVIPLACRNLGRLGWCAVPEEARTELMAASRLNAAQNALWRRELIGLLTMFHGARLRVIPLKGVALAQSLYGDATLRVCSDLDVLVPRDAVAESLRLLLANGYAHAEKHQVEPAEVDRLLDSNMEYGFRGRTAGFEYLLELHWDIAWRWRADTGMVDALWADARPGTIFGVDTWTLSPEWELLYLAVHAARHRWSALKWLVDLHEVCVRGGFDWGGVEHRARRFGLERALHQSLGACRLLLGTPLPPELEGQAPPRRLRVLDAGPVTVGGWGEVLSAVRLFPRPADKLRYLGRILLQPALAEWRLLRLPRVLRFIYYPLRPVRLGLTTSRAMVRAGRARMNL
jgi:putative nucleotidyltransferase-like protein